MSNEQQLALPNFEARKTVLTDARDKVQRMVDSPCGNDWSPRFQLLQQPKSIAEKEAYLTAADRVISSLKPLTQKTIPALERQISKLNTLKKYADVLGKSAERRKQGLSGLPEQVVTTAEAILSSLYNKDDKKETAVAEKENLLSPKAQKGHRRLPFTLPGGREIAGLGSREEAMLSLLLKGQPVSRKDIIGKVWSDVGGATEPEANESAFRMALSRLRKRISESGADEIKINVAKSEDRTSFYSLEGINSVEADSDNNKPTAESDDSLASETIENTNEQAEPSTSRTRRKERQSIKLPGGKEISGLKGKHEQMLSLLLNGKGATREKIIDNIWGNSGSKNPRRLFDTTLYSLRKKIAEIGGLKINLIGQEEQTGHALYAIEETKSQTDPIKDVTTAATKTQVKNPPLSIHGRLEHTVFHGTNTTSTETPAEEEKKI